jgi:hypothetical protein
LDVQGVQGALGCHAARRAGKPFNFAKPLNKIGEVSEDSSLLAGDDGEAAAASEMEEDM